MCVIGRFLIVLAACVSLWLTPAPASAQGDRTVRIDGNLVMRVGPVADLTADARAKEIEARLATLLNQSSLDLDLVIRPADTDAASRTVTLAGQQIVIVTPQDAAANGMDVDRLAALWGARIHDSLAQGRERRSSPGRRFLAQVNGNVRMAVARLLEAIADLIPSLLAAALVITLFGLLAAGVRRVLRTKIPLIHEPITQSFIRQISYYAIWVVGILVALDAMGFNPQTLVTGLGLASVALGLALRDLLSNVVSGVMIQAFRSFELEDQIQIGSVEGSVERIELRATHIRTYDGRLVLVPNKDVLTSVVVNNTASPVRRSAIEVHLGYTQDFPRALEAARIAAQKTQGVAARPPAYARIRELNATDVTVEVCFWTDSRRPDFMATSADVRSAIVQALKAAGISLPVPVTIDTVGSQRAETAPAQSVNTRP